MNIAVARQIKKLRLHMPVGVSMQSTLSRLADAFNTASLPGIPPSGCVFIRRMEIGRFSSTAPTVVLSSLIDARVRQLATRAVCVDHHETPDAGVVWFSDALQPYLSLAKILARGITPKAWYWRVAIPSFSKIISSATPLAALLHARIQTSFQHTHEQVRLLPRLIVQSLLDDNTLEALLVQLQPRMAAELLQSLNIGANFSDAIEELRQFDRSNYNAGSIDSLSRQTPQDQTDIVLKAQQSIKRLSVQQQLMLQRWVRTWGTNDARSIWLCVQLLAINSHSFTPSVNSMAIAHCAIDLLTHSHEAETGKNILTGANVESTLQKESANDNKEQAQPVSQQTAGKVANEQKLSQEFQFKTEIEREQETEVNSEPENYEKTAINPWDVLNPTQYAGFIFITGMLDRLGMSDILQRHQLLADYNLAIRVLFRLAQHLRIPTDDAVLSWLKPLEDDPYSEPLSFMAPQLWWNLAQSRKCENSVLIQCKVGRDQNAITNKSMRILLVLGKKEEIDQVIQTRKLNVIESKRSPRLYGDNNSYRILENANIAMLMMFLWRYCGLSLRALVNRTGFIATTSTHIDMVFDLALADIRIRKAGIDFNPGWLPWLGKVVQYHYQSQDQDYA